jgi:hypothetical protein
MGFYIPEDDILHSHRRENLKSYAVLWIIPLLMPASKTVITVLQTALIKCGREVTDPRSFAGRSNKGDYVRVCNKSPIFYCFKVMRAAHSRNTVLPPTHISVTLSRSNHWIARSRLMVVQVKAEVASGLSLTTEDDDTLTWERDRNREMTRLTTFGCSREKTCEDGETRMKTTSRCSREKTHEDGETRIKTTSRCSREKTEEGETRIKTTLGCSWEKTHEDGETRIKTTLGCSREKTHEDEERQL